MEQTLMGTMATAGAIHKVTGGAEGLPSMAAKGSEAFIGDSYANPRGSAMCSGYFELRKSDPLLYEYTYDEMKLVVQGEFRLTDMATGEVTVARERDILFFPKGTTVKFETPDYALGFFVGDRTFAP
jgi:ethanolamine utilization protein EutQ